MPTTVTKTQTIVTFSAAEVQQWIAAHMATLTPQDATIVSGQQIRDPGKIFGVSFGATPAQIDSFLRPLIPNLPPVGQYGMNFIQAPNDSNYGGLRVMWAV